MRLLSIPRNERNSVISWLVLFKLPIFLGPKVYYAKLMYNSNDQWFLGVPLVANYCCAEPHLEVLRLQDVMLARASSPE